MGLPSLVASPLPLLAEGVEAAERQGMAIHKQQKGLGGGLGHDGVENVGGSIARIRPGGRSMNTRVPDIKTVQDRSLVAAAVAQFHRLETWLLVVIHQQHARFAVFWSRSPPWAPGFWWHSVQSGN